MGGGEQIRMPDYRQYKVEDVPELMKVQERLAQHGLKDPWLRNEVWRYQLPGTLGETTTTAMFKSLLRGFPIAVALTMGIVVANKLYYRGHPDQHGHGHH